MPQREIFDGGLFPEVRRTEEGFNWGPNDLLHARQGAKELEGVDFIALLEEAEPLPE